MSKYIKNLEQSMQSLLSEGLVDDAAKLLGIDRDNAEERIKGLSFANYLELGNAIDIKDVDSAREILSTVAPFEEDAGGAGGAAAGGGGAGSGAGPGTGGGAGPGTGTGGGVHGGPGGAGGSAEGGTGSSQIGGGVFAVGGSTKKKKKKKDYGYGEGIYEAGAKQKYETPQKFKVTFNNGKSRTVKAKSRTEAKMKAARMIKGDPLISGVKKIAHLGEAAMSEARFDVTLTHDAEETKIAEGVPMSDAFKAAENQLQTFHDISIQQGGDPDSIYIEKSYWRGRVNGELRKLPEWMIEDNKTGFIYYITIRPAQLDEKGKWTRIKNKDGKLGQKIKRAEHIAEASIGQHDAWAQEDIESEARELIAATIKRVGGSSDTKKLIHKLKTGWAGWNPHVISRAVEIVKNDEYIDEADNPYTPITPPSQQQPSTTIAKNNSNTLGRKDVDNLQTGDDVEVIDIDGDPTPVTVKNPRGPGDTLVVQTDKGEEHIVKKKAVSGTPKMEELKIMYNKRLEENDNMRRPLSNELKLATKILKKMGYKPRKINVDKKTGNIYVKDERAKDSPEFIISPRGKIISAKRKKDRKAITFESAPPGMEDWIKDRKAEFKKRYGKDWEQILYATAWEQHNNESIEEGDVVDLEARREKKQADIKQWRKDNPPTCPKCDRQVERLKKYKKDDPDWLCMSCMLPIEDARNPFNEGVKANKKRRADDKAETNEEMSRMKKLAGINEVKAGNFNSRMIGQRVKIMTTQDSFGKDHYGEEGVVTRASREHTFSQMVPFIIEYGVKLDSGESITIRRDHVRKVKPSVAETSSGGATGAGAVAVGAVATGNMISRDASIYGKTTTKPKPKKRKTKEENDNGIGRTRKE